MPNIFYGYLSTHFACLALSFSAFLGFQRKKYFWLLFLAFFVLFAAEDVLFAFMYDYYGNDKLNYLFYSVIMLGFVVSLAFLYQAKPMALVFYALLSVTLFEVIRLLSMSLFAGIQIAVPNLSSIYHYLFLFILTCISVPLIYLLFRKYFVTLRQEEFNPSVIILFAVEVILPLSLSFFIPAIESSDPLQYCFFCLLQAFILLAVIFSIVLFLKKAQSDSQNAMNKVLLEKSRTMYEEEAENIKIINIKCHDIRHAASLAKDQEALKAVEDYDSQFKTGNRALDVAINDKSMHAMIKEIPFTCMADGSLLSQMTDEDIFYLFSNALENAMDYEMTLPKEKRFISVTVRKKDDFAWIHVENAFSGTLEWQNGLPKTQKSNAELHGFGLMSIKRIAEKYSGIFRVYVQDEMFQLDVMIPLSENKETEQNTK
jgi:hypothetical protein